MSFEIESITTMARPARRKKSVIFVHPTSETVMEQLINRRNRPVDLFRKAALQAIEKITCATIVENVNIRWSQKAACKCGCSPGFVVDGFIPTMYGRDIYVNIKG